MTMTWKTNIFNVLKWHKFQVNWNVYTKNMHATQKNYEWVEQQAVEYG